MKNIYLDINQDNMAAYMKYYSQSNIVLPTQNNG